MRDNLFMYILIVLFVGLGMYWIVCEYQSDKKTIALNNSPMITSCEAFTKDAFPVSIRGKLYYNPKFYSKDEAIAANYLINSCLKNEIIKYDRQDFLNNDSITKNIFNHINEILEQEYSKMYWGYITIYINDPEWYKKRQEIYQNE